MKPLSNDELQMNQDASNIAASVVSEPVVAATRCEQVTMDMAAGAAGVGGATRGMMKGMKAVTGVMPGVGKMAKGMETAGLPKSFILAVTDSQVYALDDKREGGKVIRSWPREGFRASQGASMANAAQGIPDDRQTLTLYLPIEGGKNKYLKAAAVNTAATGMPSRFMVAKDAPSQAVIDALVTASAGPNIMVGGQSLQDMVGQAAGQAAAAAKPDPAEQLTKLADLHKSGVLTDEEFAAQKAKILNA